jgi:exodeoxyribonuclease VII small subunit
MVQLFNEEEKESNEGLSSPTEGGPKVATEGGPKVATEGGPKVATEGGPKVADDTASATGSGHSSAGAVRFEDAYRRLETLVVEMERGDLPLEQLLARFEEGVSLVRHCRTFLKQAQLRVEQFVEQRDGQWVLKDVE